jgi:four helix bundle protein
MNAEAMKRRAKRFTLDVIKFVEALPRSETCRVLGRQLLRSGTSTGANYRAACRAKSTADFAYKLGIVEEEADESCYWLELLVENGDVPAATTAPLLCEGKELVAIMVSSIKTARTNASAQPSPAALRKSEIRNPKSKIG